MVLGRRYSARWRSYGFLLLNTVLWGASLVIVKPSFEVTTAFRFLLYRYVLALILSLPLLWQLWPEESKPWQLVKKVSKIELLGTVLALSLLYAGLQYTTAIEAGLLTTIQPIVITIGGVWLLKEKEEGRELSGLLLAFAGTVMLTLFPLFHNQFQLNGISITGNVLVLLAVLVNMFYFPLAKKHYRRHSKLLVSTISFWIAAACFLVLNWGLADFSWSLLWHQVLNDLSHLSVWVASGYMALFGSIIGLTAYIKGQDGIEASEASLFSYLQPLVYIPLAVVFLGEHVYPLQLLALLIILGGVVLAEKRS